jgi:hypothetical protein
VYALSYHWRYQQLRFSVGLGRFGTLQAKGDGMSDTTLQKAIDNAGHYRAIGQAEIYLHDEGSRPWKYATNMESGGLHRLGTCVSVYFHADHPCGLQFRWPFDLENKGASGKGHYDIDVAGCRAVLAKLPEAVAKQFRVYLLASAKSVEKSAREMQETVDRQMGMAAALEEAGAA